MRPTRCVLAALPFKGDLLVAQTDNRAFEMRQLVPDLLDACFSQRADTDPNLRLYQ